MNSLPNKSNNESSFLPLILTLISPQKVSSPEKYLFFSSHIENPSEINFAEARNRLSSRLLILIDFRPRER